MKIDLHLLPKLRDGLSYLYFEHCKVEQDELSIAVYDQNGVVQVPVAALGVLILGPGSSITHAAIRALAENGCMVVWTGEGGIRFYACGLGETRKGNHMQRQAQLWVDPITHAEVVLRMYRMRFKRNLPADLTLEQIRGMEGVRVREAYAQASQRWGVPWSGRNYDRGNWQNADPVNRALSAANACLYSICHTAIVSGGYLAGLGFIHTGKVLSFVYDIGDLYKVENSIPVAFEVASKSPPNLESQVRKTCRDRFYDSRLLERILPDIDRLFDLGKPLEEPVWDVDEDPARPTLYWNPPTGNGNDKSDTSS